MKLITKYNRVNVMATVIVLLAASLCYFFIIRYILIHQLDNTLKVEEAEIVSYINSNHRLPEATNYRDQHTGFSAISTTVRRKFSNISLYEERHHEYNTYRELSFPVVVGNQMFRASVTKSEEEMEHLVVAIVFITIGIIVLLLLIIFITNKVLFKKLWEPFYRTLEFIKAFNFSDKKNIPFTNSSIDEFNDLNFAVQAMQARIVKDYETLKTFADNASHEMQTPLAILNLKLDLLIQDADLNEAQTRQLQSMYDAISRLTKLNQSLLLLTKIENNQFAESSPLRLDILLKEKLVQFEDLILAKHLHLHSELEESMVRMHPYLADILLNNLLSNSIRHNKEYGEINVVLHEASLIISNAGPAFSFEMNTIFDRFKKGEHSEGIGLGLSIVKQICDNYHFSISYTFENDLHHFVVQF